jgi:uncharacterized protein (DUF488 family)
MIEYVFISGNVESLWEIDYEKNFALDVTELNIIKNNVTKYSGTIEDYLKEKGFKEVHFHDSGTLTSHAHYGSKRGCSFR